MRPGLGRAARGGVLALVLGVLAPLAGPLAAQEASGTSGGTGPGPGQVFASPVLTLDQDRLFAASAWGRRAQAEIEAASAALATENRRIEADLTAEEKSLTDRRATMDAAAFRAEADAFDAKVVRIREEQNAKSRDLTRLRDAERKAFFEAALPVLGKVLEERGAVVILDARAIFLAANAIDVTDEVIAGMDSTVGEGTRPVLPDRAGDAAGPAPAPDAPAAPQP